MIAEISNRIPHILRFDLGKIRGQWPFDLERLSVPAHALIGAGIRIAGAVAIAIRRVETSGFSAGFNSESIAISIPVPIPATPIQLAA